MTKIINTRADLDALKGTPEYLDAMQAIAGTLETTMDTAVYPDGYNEPGYSGAAVEPVWTSVETLDTIQHLGFSTRAEFEQEYAAATADGEN
ncbi:hypothetical protein FHS78_000623 [Parvibaculum indicum]|uniref:hypothetical protein n=1 Tax=Parvibaculum indicum TaxID=562969 RepID=UPI00141F5BC7|nr:hypothetical protein [Parvibaculum indicum]NIJ40353.1 hypothetical protein [Parvibaculum indicum]